MAYALSGGVFIDCVDMKILRNRSVETEVFYAELAVRKAKRREVLGIFNKPTESAQGWGEMLAELHERGVRKIGLVCAVGPKGLDDVIRVVFPGTLLQRCTTRNPRAASTTATREGDPRICGRSSVGGAAVRWEQWQTLCEKWGQDYHSYRCRAEDPAYKVYFIYLNYEARIQPMIYMMNWLERLQKGFRRVTRMRGAMSSEESVQQLMFQTAMNKKSYLRPVLRNDLDRKLFSG